MSSLHPITGHPTVITHCVDCQTQLARAVEARAQDLPPLRQARVVWPTEAGPVDVCRAHADDRYYTDIAEQIRVEAHGDPCTGCVQEYVQAAEIGLDGIREFVLRRYIADQPLFAPVGSCPTHTSAPAVVLAGGVA